MTTDVTTGVDVAAYFGRIGYRGPTEPTLATLQALVAAHNQSIPFENLDPLLGIPVADLTAPALMDKLVLRGRGGYCYEHNGLMGYVLEELGFRVERLAGRVVWMNTSGALPAQTHQVLSVTAPALDGPYLVDVGFGGQTLTSPIRLAVGPVQQTRHEPYRIREHGEGGLSARSRDPRRVAAAVHLHHPSTAADRSGSRKLVCLNASQFALRHRTDGRTGHRRCTLEPARTKSRHSPCR
jgi:arylamine N-acetyltransferase